MDFVADSIVALMRDPDAISRTFHLTAGVGNEITVRGLLKDAAEHAGIATKPLMPFSALQNDAEFAAEARVSG